MPTNIGKLSVVLSAQTSAFAKKMRGATQSIQRMSAKAKLAAAAVAGIGVAAAASVSKKILSAYTEFEAGMSRVKALTGATRSEMEKLSATAQKLGATTQFSATQSAEAMQFFALAGFKTNEIIQSMPATLALAAAGQLQISEAADIAAKTMAGMGLAADELGEVVDVMALAMTTANTNLNQLGEALGIIGPLGKAVGKDVAELTASIQTMSDAGIQGEKAGTALRNILIRMTDTGGPAAAKLKEIGVAVADDAGKVRNLSAIIGDLANATKDMTDIQRASTLSTIGGTKAVAALSVLVAKGGKELGKMEEALRNAGGTAQRVADEQLNNLRGDIIKLQSAIEGLFITIGAGQSGPLRKLVQELADLTTGINEVLQAADSAQLLLASVADEVLRLSNTAGFIANMAGFSFVDNYVSETDRLANQTGVIRDNMKAARVEMEKANRVKLDLQAQEQAARVEEQRQELAQDTTNQDKIRRGRLAATLGLDPRKAARGELDKFMLYGPLKKFTDTIKSATDISGITGSLADAVFGKKGPDAQPPGPQFAGALQRGTTAEYSARLAATGGDRGDRTAIDTEKNTEETAKNTRRMVDAIREFALTSGQSAQVVSI